MIADRNFEECQPLTWVGRYPVYLATAIAGVHAVCLILTALLLFAGAGGLVSALVFDSAAATGDFQVWRFFTYAFIYPDPSNYLWTALSLYFLAQFGAEVEKFIGRPSFCWMYVLLVLATPVALSLLGQFGRPLQFAGAGNVHFAVFLAFCAIYPRAELFLGIEARWAGAALFTINTLIYLATRQVVPGLLVLWLSSAVAMLWLMKEGVGRLSFASMAERLAERNARRRFTVVPNPAPARKVKKPEESVDPILDKIARHGMGSLSRSERDTLERARAALLEEEQRGS